MKKSRCAAFLLALLMVCFCVTPAMAADPGGEITAICIDGLLLPAAGGAPAASLWSLTVTDQNGNELDFQTTKTCWSRQTASGLVRLGSGDLFRSNQRYYLQIPLYLEASRFSMRDQYTADVEVYLNGRRQKDCMLVLFSPDSLPALNWYYTIQPVPLSALRVALTPPAAGMTVQAAMKSVAVTDDRGSRVDFSSGGAGWKTSDGKDLPLSAWFEAGQSYTLLLPLSLSEYAFDETGDGTPAVALYLNGVRQSLSGEAVLTRIGDSPAIRWSWTLPREEETPRPVFSDVRPDAWYAPAVEEAVALGLVNGKSAHRYDPEANMTFAEAAKLAACMHQRYTTGRVTLVSSADGSPWYKSYVDYCVKNDILCADDTNVLRISGQTVLELADENINRQEYVHIFAHALPEEAFPVINDIPDDAIPDMPLTMGAWSGYIYDFYRAGIVNGTDSKGTFRPLDCITRAEVAAILVRMMEPEMRVGGPVELGK